MNVEIGERRLEELLSYENMAKRLRKAGIRNINDVCELIRSHAEQKKTIRGLREQLKNMRYGGKR